MKNTYLRKMKNENDRVGIYTSRNSKKKSLQKKYHSREKGENRKKTTLMSTRVHTFDSTTVLLIVNYVVSWFSLDRLR